MFVADRVAVRECPARFLYTGSHKKNHPDTDCVAVDRAGVGRAPQGRRVGAGPGALVGGAAGGLVGAIWGGISGLMRAAVATDAKDAAIGGAKAGAVGGALGGAGRAYGAVRALGASSKLVASAEDLANVNKIRHVFGQSKHLLGATRLQVRLRTGRVQGFARCGGKRGCTSRHHVRRVQGHRGSTGRPTDPCQRLDRSCGNSSHWHCVHSTWGSMRRFGWT